MSKKAAAKVIVKKQQNPALRNITPPPEIISVPAGADSVSCDGGHPSLGHPKVWYTFDGGQAFIECKYCDRRFVRQ